MSKTSPSYLLVAEPGNTSLDYLCRFLTADAAERVKGLSARATAGTREDFPELITLQQARARLDSSAFDALNARYRDALAYFLRFLPLLPGERLIAHAIFAMAGPWRDVEKGTMAYRRETSAGIMLYLLPTVQVSDDGVVMHQAEQGPRFAPLRLVAVPDWVNTAVAASSSIVQTIGMAIAPTNPVGWVVVGGVQVLVELFSFFRREAPIPIGKIISDAISQALADLVIHESNAVLRTAYEWYSLEYEKSYTSPHGQVTIDRDQFERTLDDHIYDRTEFLKAVNRLYEADVRERALPLFVFATSVAALFFQTKHMLRTADLNRGNHGPVKQVDNSSLIDTQHYLKARMDEINPLFADLDRKASDLLSGISAPHLAQEQNCNDVNGRTVCSTYRYWRFSDGAQTFAYPDSKNGDGEAECRRRHAEHVENAKTKFLYGKRNEIVDAIAKLNDTLDKLNKKVGGELGNSSEVVRRPPTI